MRLNAIRRLLPILLSLAALAAWQAHDLDHCCNTHHEEHCSFCALGVTPIEPAPNDPMTAVAPPEPFSTPIPAAIDAQPFFIDAVLSLRAPPRA